MVKAETNLFSDKSGSGKFASKLVWKLLNYALGRKIKSTVVKQLVDENRKN